MLLFGLLSRSPLFTHFLIDQWEAIAAAYESRQKEVISGNENDAIQKRCCFSEDYGSSLHKANAKNWIYTLGLIFKTHVISHQSSQILPMYWLPESRGPAYHCFHGQNSFTCLSYHPLKVASLVKGDVLKIISKQSVLFAERCTRSQENSCFTMLRSPWNYHPNPTLADISWNICPAQVKRGTFRHNVWNREIFGVRAYALYACWQRSQYGLLATELSRFNWHQETSYSPHLSTDTLFSVRVVPGFQKLCYRLVTSASTPSIHHVSLHDSFLIWFGLSMG